MFTLLRSYLSRWFGGASHVQRPLSEEPASVSGTVTPDVASAYASRSSRSQAVPYDENLLERTRTQWQFGDWHSLSTLDREILQHHPDRAKLALLAAAGHLQTNRMESARQLIRLAHDWGCSKRLITQILVAGVHNHLGRAYAVNKQQSRALHHFEQAISIGTPGSEVKLVTEARVGHQINQLGLMSGSNGLLQAAEAVARVAHKEIEHHPKENADHSVFCADAHAFYQTLAESGPNTDVGQFILIDSKSLPRSGLHYMKNTFAHLLGRNFSFCEWYHERGCCKKMPCALRAYADQCTETNTARLRLVKSHDFELDDPVFETNRVVRRVILVREPLFILTSWFTLDQLQAHESALGQVGITMEKIWLAHEPELLATAYQVLDKFFVPPSLQGLQNWLDAKSKYMLGFHEKWVRPALEQPQSYQQVVPYEKINQYIAGLIEDLRPYLPSAAQQGVDSFVADGLNDFKARKDPYCVPSQKMTDFISENADLFYKVASRINDIEGKRVQ